MEEKIELASSTNDMGVVDDGDSKIQTEYTKGHHMDLGPGVLTVDLPCGYIDEAGKLHDTLTVAEMTGYEEDILAGQGSIVPRLNSVISNCTKRLGDLTDRKVIAGAVSCLTAADRLAALIAIRRVSLGDFYDVKVQCPVDKCKRQSRFNLNLADIDIIRMEDQMLRDRADEFGNGKMVNWHIMRAEDEAWLSSRKKRKEDVLTLAMLARIDAVDVMVKGEISHQRLNRADKKGFKEALGILKSLSIKDRNSIRKLFDKYEGSVDTEIEFECPMCEYEWKAEMPVGGAGFFFPSDK